MQLTTLDSSDGVPSIGYYAGYTPYVTKSADGKIWFVHGEGVSVIDPRHLLFNRQQPPVYVEQITADGKRYQANSYEKGGLGLPPLLLNLTINYTALSLAVPEKAHSASSWKGRTATGARWLMTARCSTRICRRGSIGFA